MVINFLPDNINIDIDSDNSKSLLKIAFENNVFIGEGLCGARRCGRCKVIVSKGNDYNITDVEKRILLEDEIERDIRLACCFVPHEDVCVIVIGRDKNAESYKGIYKGDSNKIINRNSNEILESNQDLANNKSPDFTSNTTQNVAIVFDIGTTNIKAAAVNIDSKKVIEEIKVINPQTSIGSDVIIRIGYAITHPDGLCVLQSKIVDKLNEIIKHFVDKNTNLVKLIAVGNTTMINILGGYDISPLGIAPFESKFKAGISIKAHTLGFNVNKEIDIYLPKIIAGHVGSDAYACLQAMSVSEDDNSWTDKNKISAIVDIGTNGEIILNNKGKLSVCSTAAGPAFENTRGITGSEIIDIIAELLKKGIIDNTGYLIEDNIQGKLKITQEDIRSVQLAKAAINAALITLLSENNIGISDLNNIYIAGEFGEKIDVQNAITIGLLPKVPKDIVIQTGNIALKGAIDMLFAEKEVNIDEITHYELATMGYFNELYISNVDFTN